MVESADHTDEEMGYDMDERLGDNNGLIVFNNLHNGSNPRRQSSWH
jgi:hypothetical protein